MTPDERGHRIESYGAAHELLVAAVGRFPREMWQFRPAPGAWTIHEIIVHIADSEANSYVRCRRLIAEPGSEVLGYDELTWARELRYHAQDPDEALELFRWLRRQSFTLIRHLPVQTWKHEVNHSANGPMTMDDWLEIYERHVPDHIEQMAGVYAGWLSRSAGVD
jgi:hypothetical protein